MQTPHAVGARAVYLAVAPLYAGFGLCLGLIQVALPTVLQRQGMLIEHAGYLALLFVPFGLSALWAPMVDRFRLLGLERRLGWVTVSQSLVVASLVAIAFAGPQGLVVLVPALAVLAIAAATMDVTLDGYLSETSSSEGRAVRGGLKVSCMYIGTIAGATLALFLFERLGWTIVLLLAAAICTGMLGLFLAFFEPAPAIRQRQGAGFRRFLFERGMWDRVLLVAAAGMLLGVGLSAPRLLLVERGASFEAIGILFGPVSMLIGLLGALSGMFLGNRHGSGSTLVCAGALFAAGMLAMSVAPDLVFGRFEMTALAIGCAALAYGAAYGGVSAVALGWTSRDRAATDYSVVQSVWNSSIILGGALGGLALGLVGTVLFGLVGCCVFVFFWLLALRPAASLALGAR